MNLDSMMSIVLAGLEQPDEKVAYTGPCLALLARTLNIVFPILSSLLLRRADPPDCHRRHGGGVSTFRAPSDKVYHFPIHAAAEKTRR